MLKPASKSIYLLQGQSGEVTCEAEGPSVSTLKWEKQQDDKSYAAVPNSQVNITKDANYVRATLKITNAQFADTGTYKCTVSVPPNKSDYKETNITVMGRLALLYCIVRLLLIAWICFRSPRDQFLVKEPTHYSKRVGDVIPGVVVYLHHLHHHSSWVGRVQWAHKWTDSGCHRRP